MNRYWIYITTLLLSAFFTAACTKDSEPDDTTNQIGTEITITASHREGTKTALVDGGTHVYWKPGDAIKLVRLSSDGRPIKWSKFSTDITSPSRVASFIGIDPEGDADYIGVYPYDGAECDDATSVAWMNLTIPHTQTATPGSFSNDAYLTIARSPSREMAFYAVSGGIRFTLCQEGITRIIMEALEGEKLTGTIRGIPTVSETGIKFEPGYINDNKPSSPYVTLIAPEGATFQTGTWYYIVTLPTGLRGGFKLTFFKENLVASKVYTTPITIERGVFRSREHVDSEVLFKQHEAVDFGLSVNWAVCNVGAVSPEELGDRYTWGDTTPYDGSPNYKWIDEYNRYTKYNDEDGWTELLPNDDAATATWGSDWKMPTADEVREFTNKVVPSNSFLGGVAGLRICRHLSGSVKSIFIPGSSFFFQSPLYWTSSRCFSDKMAYGAYWVEDYDNCCYSQLRNYAGYIRPVSIKEPTIGIRNLTLNKTKLTLSIGQQYTLSATIKPSDIDNATIIWTSSNPSIVDVDSYGKITAIAPGSSMITATCQGGEMAATCPAVVLNDNADHEAVDLGLSVKWAACNLGAVAPEDGGCFYAWGETTDKEVYNWTTYKWCKGVYNSITKYCPTNKTVYWNGEGSPDNKSALDIDDDAATINWGGNWRMPTYNEWNELINNCIWAWETINGINGYRVIGRNVDRSIFIPVAGWYSDSTLNRAETTGCYWSSSLNTSSPIESKHLYITEGYNYKLSANSRYLGYLIRPVCP